MKVGRDIPPSPEEVPELLEELLAVTPETQLEALDWHIRFEKIHPFADGNGRIGRLIYLWKCHSLLVCDPIIWRGENKHGYYTLYDDDSYTPKL